MINNKNTKRLLSSSITFVLLLSQAPNAFALEGDTLAILSCAGPGVGVGFDGVDVYWLGFSDTSLRKCTTAGVALPPVPIVGLSNGIDTISWDSTRNVFWAATSDLGGGNRDIYTVTQGGVATFQFTANANGFGFTDGLSYDGTDDSIWISGDVANTVFHYDTNGVLLGTISPVISAGGCGNSGIAVGGPNTLYLGFNGCNEVQRMDKTGIVGNAFPVQTQRTEDLECDNITFAGLGVDAIWTKDAGDSDLVAFEVPQGTCTFGGGGEPVGGSILPIDASALLIAGAFTNAIWIAPVLAGAAGATAFYIKTRKN